MHKVLISLASNIHHEENLDAARQAVSRFLNDVTFTSILWTKPINTPNPSPYLNQLAAGATELTIEELENKLKDAEIQIGRTDDERRKKIVPADLDILMFDETKYHLRDWDRPYVKELLEQLPSFLTV